MKKKILKKIPTIPPLSSHLAVLFLGLFSASLFTQPRLDATSLPAGKWLYLIKKPSQDPKSQSLVPAINLDGKPCKIRGARHLSFGQKHVLEFDRIHRRQVEQLENIVWAKKNSIREKCIKIYKIKYGDR